MSILQRIEHQRNRLKQVEAERNRVKPSETAWNRTKPNEAARKNEAERNRVKPFLCHHLRCMDPYISQCVTLCEHVGWTELHQPMCNTMWAYWLDRTTTKPLAFVSIDHRLSKSPRPQQHNPYLFTSTINYNSLYTYSISLWPSTSLKLHLHSKPSI